MLLKKVIFLDGLDSTQLKFYDICRIQSPQKKDILTSKIKNLQSAWAYSIKNKESLEDAFPDQEPTKHTSVVKSSPVSTQKSKDMLT